MKLALELEFPDDQATRVLRLVQSVPDFTARILPHPASVPTSASKSEALFQRLAGSWQSDENGDELNRQLREARQDQPRDIEL